MCVALRPEVRDYPPPDQKWCGGGGGFDCKFFFFPADLLRFQTVVDVVVKVIYHFWFSRLVRF